MPVQIDHMETAIEIARPSGNETGSASRGATPAPVATGTPSSADRAALSTSIGQVLAAELDRFLKMRGM